MSGSTGGNRIDREDVLITVRDYQTIVLSGFKKIKSYEISGSFNNPDKKNFGDIDIILQVDSKDKKAVKKEFADYVSSLDDYDILPFKSEKYKGKKFLNTGEIITVLYHNGGLSSVWNKNGPHSAVQIDNIFALSKEEADFKKHFLDLPAEKQGLMLGLVKTVLIEEFSEEVSERMSVDTNFHYPSQNCEYEFSLSSSELQIRLIKFEDGENFKEISREVVWRSQNWQDVENLLWDYNFNVSFDNILELMKQNFKNPRSGKRVRGLFNSMVTIKTGEIGTQKGDDKERNIKKVNEIFGD